VRKRHRNAGMELTKRTFENISDLAQLDKVDSRKLGGGLAIDVASKNDARRASSGSIMVSQPGIGGLCVERTAADPIVGLSRCLSYAVPADFDGRVIDRNKDTTNRRRRDQQINIS
jgi:hypothetical protein